MITKKDLIKEIKRQHKEAVKRIEKSSEDQEIKEFEKKLISYNFLGFIENEELTNKVEQYFSVTQGGHIYYDWVNGNKRLKELIKEVVK